MKSSAFQQKKEDKYHADEKQDGILHEHEEDGLPTIFFLYQRHHEKKL